MKSCNTANCFTQSYNSDIAILSMLSITYLCLIVKPVFEFADLREYARNMRFRNLGNNIRKDTGNGFGPVLERKEPSTVNGMSFVIPVFFFYLSAVKPLRGRPPRKFRRQPRRPAGQARSRSPCCWAWQGLFRHRVRELLHQRVRLRCHFHRGSRSCHRRLGIPPPSRRS